MMRQDKTYQRLWMVGLLLIGLLLLPVSGFSAEEVKVAPETKAPASAPAPAAAEEDKPTGDISVSLLNQYIWRGYELSRNSAVIQPSLTVGYKGFSAAMWGNLDTKPYYAGAGDSPYSSTMNETDFTLSYTKTMGIVNLGGGYIYYSLGSLNKDLPERADMQELFVSVGLNTLLAPTLTVYRELDHYHNWYFLLGVSHTFELHKAVSLKLAATASYLSSTYADAVLFNAGAGYGGYPKVESNGTVTNDKFNNFHDGSVTASLPIKIAKYITLTPTLSYIFPLSSDAKYEMRASSLKGTTFDDKDSSYVVGGLTASFTF